MTKEQELKLQEQALLSRLNKVRKELKAPTYDVEYTPMFVVIRGYVVKHQRVTEVIGVFDDKEQAANYVKNYVAIHNHCEVCVEEKGLNVEEL